MHYGLEIYNLRGRLILRGEINSLIGVNSLQLIPDISRSISINERNMPYNYNIFQLPISSLNQGVYFVKILDNSTFISNFQFYKR